MELERQAKRSGVSLTSLTIADMSTFATLSGLDSRSGDDVSGTEVGSGVASESGTAVGSGAVVDSGAAVDSGASVGAAVAVGSGELTCATESTPPVFEEQATNNNVIIAKTGKIVFDKSIFRF